MHPGLCDYIGKNEDLPSVSTQEYIKGNMFIF